MNYAVRFHSSLCRAVGSHVYLLTSLPFQSQSSPRPKITTRPPPARRCPPQRWRGARPSPSLRATRCAVSWTGASACTTWEPGSGISLGTWYVQAAPSFIPNTYFVRLAIFTFTYLLILLTYTFVNNHILGLYLGWWKRCRIMCRMLTNPVKTFQFSTLNSWKCECLADHDHQQGRQCFHFCGGHVSPSDSTGNPRSCAVGGRQNGTLLEGGKVHLCRVLQVWLLSSVNEQGWMKLS